MRNTILKLYMTMRNLKDGFIRDECGQDLVEYALVLALIALAATVSMKTLATNIGTAFTSVGTKLTTYTS